MKFKDILLAYGITAIVLWIVSFILVKPLWLEATWETSPLWFKILFFFIVIGIGCLWLRHLISLDNKTIKSTQVD
jgi:hypothetical protein